MVKKMLVRFLVLLICYGLVGCASVSYAPTGVRIFPALKDSVPATTDSPSVALLMPAPGVKSFTYGRFTVRVEGDMQVVEHSPMLTSEMPIVLPYPTTQAHAIFVNYTTKELMYYRRTADGIYEPVIGYAVMTPFPSVLPREVVRGKVERIVHKPTWCPKPGGTVVRERPELGGKGCFPHGHPLNAMGDWRFDMAWDAPGWELNKLHGVDGYAPGAFWTENTHGCIRLTNPEIAHLIDLLGPNAIREGIEIISFSGTTPEKMDERKSFRPGD